MADLTAQTTTVTGTVALTAVTPTVTVGDWVPIGSYVTVRNASGGSINVTIVTPGNDSYGRPGRTSCRRSRPAPPAASARSPPTSATRPTATWSTSSARRSPR
jgi:hypothetical protein